MTDFAADPAKRSVFCAGVASPASWKRAIRRWMTTSLDASCRVCRCSCAVSASCCLLVAAAAVVAATAVAPATSPFLADVDSLVRIDLAKASYVGDAFFSTASEVRGERAPVVVSTAVKVAEAMLLVGLTLPGSEAVCASSLSSGASCFSSAIDESLLTSPVLTASLIALSTAVVTRPFAPPPSPASVAKPSSSTTSQPAAEISASSCSVVIAPEPSFFSSAAISGLALRSACVTLAAPAAPLSHTSGLTVLSPSTPFFLAYARHLLSALILPSDVPSGMGLPGLIVRQSPLACAVQTSAGQNLHPARTRGAPPPAATRD